MFASVSHIGVILPAMTNYLDEILKALSANIVAVIVVGISSAITAYVKRRITTSRQRTRVKEDMEFIEKLPEGSTARKHLEAAVEERILRMSFQDYADTAMSTLRWAFLFCAVMGAATTTAVAFDTSPENRGAAINAFTMAWYTAFLLIAVVAVVPLFIERRSAERKRAQFITARKYPDPADKWINSQPGRLRSGLAALRRRFTPSRQTNNTIPLPAPEPLAVERESEPPQAQAS